MYPKIFCKSGPWISFRKISRAWKVFENGLIPGKSWKILVQGPGKSCSFLGYDMGGGHNDAGADANICKN